MDVLIRIHYRLLTQAPCFHEVNVAGNGNAAKGRFDCSRHDLVSLDYVLVGGVMDNQGRGLAKLI